MREFSEILDRKIEYYGETRAAHQFAAEEYANEITKARILEEMKFLTNNLRLEIFSEYCKACGSPNPNCQCWNDE